MVFGDFPYHFSQTHPGSSPQQMPMLEECDESRDIRIAYTLMTEPEEEPHTCMDGFTSHNLFPLLIAYLDNMDL